MLAMLRSYPGRIFFLTAMTALMVFLSVNAPMMTIVYVPVMGVICGLAYPIRQMVGIMGLLALASVALFANPIHIGPSPLVLWCSFVSVVADVYAIGCMVGYGLKRA